MYIFVDESGDRSFSEEKSSYYIFTFLIGRPPFCFCRAIYKYRCSLLERNLQYYNQKKLNVECFHACEDNKYVRNKLFNFISELNKDDIGVYIYPIKKQKSLKKNEDFCKFYADNLKNAVEKLLEKLNICRSFIIITDRLPVANHKKSFTKGLKEAISQYLKRKKLKETQYDVFHHSSASSINLQITDYISWAFFRKLEKGESCFYNKIKKYLIENPMTLISDN